MSHLRSHSSSSSRHKKLSDFTIKRRIGNGAFASVFHAFHQKTGNEYAIKKINKKYMKERNMIDRVQNEALIHYSAHHPSILRMYDFFEDDHHAYLVLEYCRNGDLNNYLHKRKRLSNDEARCMLRQIVEGMIYLNDNNVMHRDLKPANLLLDEHNNIKICDFGLACEIQSKKEKHLTMCGTPNNIAPEIANKSQHGLECDVWSIGVLLYQFLVGKPPFDTDTVTGTLERVKKFHYRIPTHISEDATDLIQHMLQPPQQRIKLHDILLHRFMKPGSGVGGTTCHSSSVDSGHYTLSTTNNSASPNRTGSATNSGGDGRFEKRPMRKTHPIDERPSCRLNDDDEISGDDGYSGDDVTTSRANDMPGNRGGWKDHHPMTSTRVHHSLDRYRSYQSSSPVGHHQYRTTRPRSKSPGRRAEWSTPHKDQDLSEMVQNMLLQQNENQQQQTPVVIDRGRSQQRRFSHHNPPPLLSSINNSTSSLRDRLKGPLLPISLNQQQQKPHQHHRNRELPEVKTRSKSVGVTSSSKRHHTSGSGTSGYNSQLTPITTDRIQAFRQRTQLAMITLLDDGSTCLEVINKDVNKIERVTEVAYISSDGQIFTVFKPSGGLLVGENPPPIPLQAQRYPVCKLPTKHHKKYKYIERFVNVAKSKTPKITYFTDQAKCCLMENEDNLEFAFYNGTKLIRISNEKSQIVTEAADGNNQVAKTTTIQADVLNQEHDDVIMQYCTTRDDDDDDVIMTYDMILHAREMSVVLKHEEYMKTTSNVPYKFPVRVGRRPASSKRKTDVNNTCVTTSTTPPSSRDGYKWSQQQQPSTVFDDTTPIDGLYMTSYTTPLSGNRKASSYQGRSTNSNSRRSISDQQNDLRRTETSNKTTSSNNQSQPSSSSSIDLVSGDILDEMVNKVYVKDEGSLVHFFRTQMWIKYDDNTQLLIGNQLYPFDFQFSNGQQVRYYNEEQLPPLVQRKTEQLGQLYVKFSNNNYKT